jgi:lipopolysaccharide heptosyltransferase II
MFRRFSPADLCRLNPKRICLIKPSALGDVVQTLPLLPVLKQRFPDASISWVVNRELRDLVDGHPDLSESIPFERQGRWSGWLKLLGELASRRFDLTIDLQGLLRTGVMTLATRAAVRVGLETAREGSAYSLNCVIPKTPRQMAAHARYWRLAEVLGLGDFPRDTLIVTSPADEAWAAKQLGRLPRPVFAVHPGARWVTKRWPVPKFANLLTRAVQSWSGTVLILGSKGELSDARQLEHELIARSRLNATISIVNLAGQSTLKQLTALLKRVDFAISNDSGPMHLAAGLGIPTLGLFTCTSATRSGPPGDCHELVSTTVSCAAGYHKTCPMNGEHHLSCHAELNVERAWLALQRLVSKNQRFQRVA